HSRSPGALWSVARFHPLDVLLIRLPARARPDVPDREAIHCPRRRVGKMRRPMPASETIRGLVVVRVSCGSSFGLCRGYSSTLGFNFNRNLLFRFLCVSVSLWFSFALKFNNHRDTEAQRNQFQDPSGIAVLTQSLPSTSHNCG